MSSIILISILFLCSIPLSNYLKRTWIESSIVVLNFFILLGFILGLMNVLSWIKFFVYALPMISLFYFLRQRKQAFIHLVSLLKEPNLYLGLILILVVIFINNNRYFLRWDEFTHWGLAAKNISVNHSFNWNMGTILGKGYPPAGALTQYLFGIFSKSFVEENAFIAFGTYGSLVLASFITPKSKDQLLAFLSLFIILIFLSLNMFNDFLSTAYIDGMLGMAFSYAIYSSLHIHKGKWFDYLVYFNALLVLVLMKTTGYQFALIIVLSNLFILVFVPIIKTKDIKKIIHPLWLALGLVWGINRIWFAYTYQESVLEIQQAGLSLSTYNNNWLSLLTLNFPKAYQLDVFNNYIQTVFFNSKSFYLNLSIGMVPIVLIMINGFLFYLSGKHQRNNHRLIFQGLISLGFYTYLMYLLMFYLFSFSEWEASFLDSIDRYINAYLIALIIYSLFYMVEQLVNQKVVIKTSITLVIFITSIFLLPNIESNVQINRYNALYSQDIRKIYDPLVDFSQQLKPDDKVFFIAQNTNGFDYYAARYYFTPNQVSSDGFSFGPLYYEGDTSIDLSVDELEERIKGYDYVYIMNTDDRFYGYYHFIFSDPNQLIDQSAFSVNLYDDNQHVSLNRVYPE